MRDLFVWMKEYGVGVENIDSQHKNFFEITNRLWGDVRPGELEDLLMQIYRHTREHFRDEEQFMKDVGYPDLAEHRDAHDQLLSRFNDLSRAAVNDSSQLEPLRTFLAEWIVHHTVEHDQKFSRFIQ